jgi:hypothetical protein
MNLTHINLNHTSIHLLRQFVALPLNQRVQTGAVPTGLDELEAAGYAQIIPIGMSQHLIEITDGGRQALAEFEQAVQLKNIH